MCARVLQMHGVDVTVFEREQSPDARGQGGTLDMHPDTGQVALAAAGLLDKFTALARPEGQEMRVLDHVTAAITDHVLPGDAEEAKPEIDRGQLRGLLLESLADGTVQWGLGVSAVHPSGHVLFADGTETAFDLVIGADGAWSKVRLAVSDTGPEYTGVTFVETGFHAADHPDLAERVGNGLMLAKSTGKAIFGQRNSGGRIRVYMALRTQDTIVDTTGIEDLFHGWHESLRALTQHGDYIVRPLYTLPAPHIWSHNPKITLIGDAAHLMPPLGVGANLALLDGTELAHAIVNEPEDPVQTYESVMLPRSAEIAKACIEGLATLLP